MTALTQSAAALDVQELRQEKRAIQQPVVEDQTGKPAVAEAK